MHTATSRRTFLASTAALLALPSWRWTEAQAQGQKIVINYPTRSGASWHLYLAKEGGYYQKYGLDVDLQFGVHPTGVAMLTSGQAVMVNHSLEQGMLAGTRDANAFTLVGSSSNKGLFALHRAEGVLEPQAAQRQAHRHRADRRRAVQLHGGAARHLRAGRARRPVDPGGHRRERPRGGAADQPR